MTVWMPSDLDVVFVTTDEPNADKNYSELSASCWRKPLRINGGGGVRAVHSEAARVATTARFFLVDGDTLADSEVLRSGSLDDKGDPSAIFAYDASNAVNGLCYAHGGVTCWPRHLGAKIPHHPVQTHLAASEDRFNTDPLRTFRTAYREVVRLTTMFRPTAEEFPEAWVAMPASLRSWLLVWLSVGTDRPYGEWSIIGARRGLVDLWMQRTLDPKQIEDDAFVASRYERVAAIDTRICMARLGHILMPLGLEVPVLDAAQCDFFRSAYLQPSLQ